jgi:D-serine deaminase-like pyridoxal phosphate-dependent protein
MDRDYARNTLDDQHGAIAFDHALFVLATVMSMTTPDQAVVDAGHKALSNDSGFPAVWQRPDIGYHRPSDEHGVLTLADGAPRLSWGEKVLLVPVIATRPSISTTGMSACAAWGRLRAMWRRCG